MAAAVLAAGSIVGVTAAEASEPLTVEIERLTADDAEVFVGVTPFRLVDTRSGDGVEAAGPLGPDASITVRVAGVGSIPSGATSVALNTTFPQTSTERSYMTIWPTGHEQPFTAVNNAAPGVDQPNFIVSKLGDGGSIDVFNASGQAHVVLDVAGYYVPLSSLDETQTPGGRLYAGSGEPAADLGDDGDFFIDELTVTMYGPKADGTWGIPMAEFADIGQEVLTGDGPPAASIGDDGDLYVDQTDLVLYGPKDEAGWPTGLPIGPDGVGSTVLSGDGSPDDVDGVDGDVYLDRSGLVLHGPKAGSWGSSPAIDLDPGVAFLLGTGVPDTSLGAEGDLYVDGQTLVVYGPKSKGGWSVATDLDGPPTVESESAIHAYSTGAYVDLVVGGSTALDFDSTGASVGTAISRVDDDTFSIAVAGTYRVAYEITAGLGVAGDIDVVVGGSPVTGHFSPLTAGASASGIALVHAAAGDELEIQLSALAGVAGTIDGSLVVELVAVD